MGSESVDKAEWTKSLTITLIGLYEHHLCLYDVKNKFYSNKHARVEALNTIVGRLNEEPGVNFTVDDVKKKIANLRSQFNHELSKINSSKRSGGGTDDLYEPSVWWFEYMAFIKKFIKTRKGKSNLESQTQMDTAHNNCLYDVETTESEAGTAMEFSESELMNNTQITHVPKSKRTKHEEDGILQSSLNILSDIQNSIQPTDVNTMEYARYIARELLTIDDAELLNDAKHEINNILYLYKKKFIQNVKAGVILEHI
ncbi:uncharacterized protein LOC116174125 isoform X2 [Photinus pyralis]|uniref:uncharacterized protein LOC116174125 isoform X2 n=1 Tax=Photinus pyralis TaxID=7054 RepID=UPI00126703E8|nr:uncharacterized protein LOC116174125 isoform X2 [Photinus pyralis]